MSCKRGIFQMLMKKSPSYKELSGLTSLRLGWPTEGEVRSLGDSPDFAINL